MTSAIPAIEGYTHDDVFYSKSDKNTCRLKQCNNLATSKCSKSMCRFDFCATHATHKHFLCEYCPDSKVSYGTHEIKVDKQVACESCVTYLLNTRCCKNCHVWLTKERSVENIYCYECSPKCVHCRGSMNNNGSLCASCDRTQRACYTQGITGYYGRFN